MPPLLSALTGPFSCIWWSWRMVGCSVRYVSLDVGVAFLVLLAFAVVVVAVAFGASGREGTLSGPRELAEWPSVVCLCLSLTYRFFI